MCILCVRRKVSQLFYHYLITKTSPEICIQPHYNIIERPNEYNKDCVFLPTALAGITDPFVMHLRHNYKYKGNGIVQHSSVNFSQASSTCDTIFLERTIEHHHRLLKHTEAEYFKAIQEATTFKEKYRLEQQLYLEVPIIYGHSESLNWTQIVTTILDASVFLPIIFGQKISTDKTTKNIPIIHIISKGLPQRSQFRNFLTISLNCLEHSEDFALFFKQLFVWSIIGIHYHWNTICIPLYKRIQLFELCCVQDTDWKKLLTINVRLFFFMIKEYLCFIIKQNPGLHTILVGATDWIKYETEIFSVMNNVRQIFATSDNNPLKQMMSLTQKLLPRPNIVNWPKIYQPLQETSQVKIFVFLGKKGFKPIIEHKMQSIGEYRTELQRLLLSLSTEYALGRALRLLEINDEMDTVDATESISPQILQKFFNMMFIRRILQSIRQTTLPLHQIQNQLNTAIKRHDLNTSDPLFTNTLYATTTYYFCVGCEDVSLNIPLRRRMHLSFCFFVRRLKRRMITVKRRRRTRFTRSATISWH